jgi:hypothetical protein
MAQGVVDGLEVIDVQHQQAIGHIVFTSPGHGVPRPLAHQIKE